MLDRLSSMKMAAMHASQPARFCGGKVEGCDEGRVCGVCIALMYCCMAYCRPGFDYGTARVVTTVWRSSGREAGIIMK